MVFSRWVMEVRISCKVICPNCQLFPGYRFNLAPVSSIEETRVSNLAITKNMAVNKRKPAERNFRVNHSGLSVP